MMVHVFKWDCPTVQWLTFFFFLFNGLIVTLLVYLVCLEFLFIWYVSLLLILFDSVSFCFQIYMISLPLSRPCNCSVVWFASHPLQQCSNFIMTYLLGCGNLIYWCRRMQMARPPCLSMKGKQVLESFMVSEIQWRRNNYFWWINV